MAILPLLDAQPSIATAFRSRPFLIVLPFVITQSPSATPRSRWGYDKLSPDFSSSDPRLARAGTYPVFSQVR